VIKRNSKLIGLISVILSGAVFMSACSVDTEAISEAFDELSRNLGEAVSEPESSETTESTDVIVVETVVETSNETQPDEPSVSEPEETPVPEATATPTATPSPTPMPQRVDFSELTSDDLFGTITVETEEFIESSHAEDDDDIILATFSGHRVLLSSKDDIAVVTAVNLMLNGFYMEAEGLYNRAVSETAAQYSLLEDEEPSAVNVKVDYECFFNGRLLGVIMTYEVEQEDEVTNSATEYVMYDLYTGQYVLPEMLFADVDGLYADICDDIAHDSEDTHDKASDYSVVFIAANDEEDDDIPAIVLVLHDGDIEEYEVDLTDYEQYVSRNGRILLGFNRFEAAALAEEEDVDEEDTEEVDDEEIDDEEVDDEEVDDEEDD